MKRSDVVELVTLFQARYPNAKWADDEVTYRVWFDMLSDLPAAMVAQVVPDMMKQSPFPPDPSDIRSRLFSETGILPEPDVAWGMVVERIKGKREPGDTPYPVNLCVKELGGLFQLRGSERPEQDRERFIKAYSARRKQAMTDPETVGMLDALAIGAGSK